MPSLHEGRLRLDFPIGWEAQKYDEWTFYRQQFLRARDGLKGVDVLAWDPAWKTAWLVEIKDYRQHGRQKDTELWREVADKVLDTLSGLLPAAVNSNSEVERALARKVLQAKRIRVVLHLEQRQHGSRLHPRAIEAADVKQKLKQVLRAVDSHPQVVETARMGGLAWAAS